MGSAWAPSGHEAARLLQESWGLALEGQPLGSATGMLGPAWWKVLWKLGCCQGSSQAARACRWKAVSSRLGPCGAHGRVG